MGLRRVSERCGGFWVFDFDFQVVESRIIELGILFVSNFDSHSDWWEKFLRRWKKNMRDFKFFFFYFVYLFVSREIGIGHRFRGENDELD